MRKKKPEKKKPDAPAVKPAAELTTDEAMARMFTKPVADALRRVVESEKPEKPPMNRG